jgi:hypothetical protein
MAQKFCSGHHLKTVVIDLLEGQYHTPVRIISFNISKR